MFNHTEHCDALYYHEAGHAVVRCALGLGISRIEIKIDGSSGRVYGTQRWKRSFASAKRRLLAGARNAGDLRLFIAIGISSAAGMAAERKLAILDGTPLAPEAAAKGGLVSDHDYWNIENIEKMLARWRRPFAFERLVWSRAQTAMDDPRVWAAVEGIAEELSIGWDDADRDDVYTMNGQRARAIMRSHGVRPGMALCRPATNDRSFRAEPAPETPAPPRKDHPLERLDEPPDGGQVEA
ncbi:hypothetical protein [Roseiarcus fermentans]|nr:hypothetical protein [Roseiarcus fermentans]